ncbi:stage II sporulation protein P [Ectobacillus sp. JY-23]|uniref:stage II sporulation protein P n=1 Tax=Ectobacillus sp. JY-23 TaxID=2933872 RepID=UPI001FF24B62|nr:stage II sporulation protein P [Ectobacillus sp. JY-23]UOY92778.1 stage II sporulation protein P [Ectobacillus sp. JY-23]
MKRSYFYVQKTRVSKLFLFILVAIISTFLCTSMMVTSLKHAKSTYLHSFLGELSMNGYMYAFGMENHYFTQEYRSLNKEFSLSSLFLSTVTNIRFDDVRSLIGTELPGFTKYDTEILIAGEGTNYSNLPIESSVPLEELTKERKGEAVPPAEAPKQKPPSSTGSKKVVFIYHSHSWESYLPMLNLTNDPNANKASSSVSNISIFGDRLREQLEGYGIGTTNDKTDIGKLLISKGLNSNSSYKVSRQVVQTAMTSNKDLQYFFDIHRDSARKPVTTKQLNGKSYAKFYFIIGAGNKNYTQNEKLALALHEQIEKKYPGLSRGVGRKDFRTGNGIYNQDLSGQAILIELGGVDNTVEELNRSIDVLAEVFSEYFWQAERVNG